jgi:hypothetical protein
VDPVPVPLLTAPAGDEAVRALCNASSLKAGGRRSGMVGDTVPSAFSLKPPRRLKKPLGDCSGSSGDSLPDSEPTSLRDGLRPARSLSMKNAILKRYEGIHMKISFMEGRSSMSIHS